MKTLCHECGAYAEVSAWIECEWGGGDEEYYPVCGNCYRDITGDIAQNPRKGGLAKACMDYIAMILPHIIRRVKHG